METTMIICLIMSAMCAGLSFMYLRFMAQLALRDVIAWGYVANAAVYFGVGWVLIGIGFHHNTCVAIGLWILLPSLGFGLFNTVRLRKVKVQAVLELEENRQMLNDQQLEHQYTYAIKERVGAMEKKMMEVINRRKPDEDAHEYAGTG